MNTKKEILPAVAAVIFNDNGDILLQKRKDVGKWCVISGHVEFGETIEDAILREIFEETNAHAKISRFIGVYSSPIYQTYCYEDRTVQYVTAYFEAKLEEDIDCSFINNETQELKFFSLTKMPNNFAQINPYWLEDALNKNATAFLR